MSKKETNKNRPIGVPVKAISIKELIEKMKDQQPIEHTEEEIKEINSLLKELGKDPGFMAFNIPVKKKEEK